MIEHARYEVLSVLGRGGEGVVLHVRDRERPGIDLAAKVLASHDEAARVRLAGEVSLLVRLRGPGLVRVHDLQEDARGRLFLVEDLVRGQAPGAWVSGSASRLASLVASLAETLAVLHDAGFVHGDVKPGNVIVTTDGRPMLLDLGASASRAASPVAPSATPAFAAPEILSGARSSVASDLYGLGATAWTCIVNEPPPSHGGRTAAALRRDAAWLPPSLARLVVAMLAEHPADRPRTARDVLRLLGRDEAPAAHELPARGAHAHEALARELLAAASPVTWVVGPSGAGKSHLAREIVARALLAGRDVRHVRFPEDARATGALLALLRGEAESPGTLVVLDDHQHAAPELEAALEAYRCAPRRGPSAPCFVVTAQRAPAAASVRDLGPLAPEAFDALAADLGVADAAARDRLARETGRLPGWLVAAIGRAPLTREAVLERVAELPSRARGAIALVAALGGVAPVARVDREGASAAYAEGLLVREGPSVRLGSPHLSDVIAAALVDAAVIAQAAEVVTEGAPSTSTMAVARASAPSSTRTRLIELAAERARAEGARALEIEALRALAAEGHPSVLLRLERLLRDAGVARAHPEVLAQLEAAAEHDFTLRPLALRRRAEARARAGDAAAAEACARAALEAARGVGTLEEGYVHATRGAIALYAADWERAGEALAVAADVLAHADPARVDAEERARLEHNLGVVAMYAGRHGDAASAFARAVAEKRRLGDLAGVRASLSNLGLASAKAGDFDAASLALEEALALAVSLGQEAGRAWTLASFADLALKRGRAEEAEDHVAEALAMGDAVPPAVRADLVLALAEARLIGGHPHAAVEALASIDPSLRAEDALVDARAHVLASRAALASLPADRRRAAREAVKALRRSRESSLVEVFDEASRALAESRGRSPTRASEGAPAPSGGESMDLETVLVALARGSAEEGVAAVASHVLAAAGAERVLVARLGDAGASEAWGVDMDGLALADARARVDGDAVAAAVRARAPVHQRDVAFRGGRGARLVVAGEQAVVVVEHRFRAGAFDAVAASATTRWALLADLAVRLAAGPRADAAASWPAAPIASHATTTAIGRDAPAREHPGIVGASAALRRALATLDGAVGSDLPVLVLGETGTGKELFARAVHEGSARAAAPFVAVNCAAIPEALFEAELFGHARGAFTGAERARPGLFVRAAGGTLFLDEVGELPLARQASLLRALETRRCRPVGADDEVPFDVRVVAATNRDLDAAARAGTFREDLLFRLRVLEVVVPPLRDRAGDVEVLFRHFLRGAGSRATVTDAALRVLAAYAWPGNVRELANVAQRVAAGGALRIDVAHLPRVVRAASRERRGPEDERSEVEAALARCGGNISHAAALLGITRHGLKKRMLRLGVRARAEAKA